MRSVLRPICRALQLSESLAGFLAPASEAVYAERAAAATADTVIGCGITLSLSIACRDAQYIEYRDATVTA